MYMKIKINDNHFSKNIKRLRLASGLTQEQTVAKMNVIGSPISRSTYSWIEMGRGNIFISDFVALQKILKADFSQFFEGVGPEK